MSDGENENPTGMLRFRSFSESDLENIVMTPKYVSTVEQAMDIVDDEEKKMDEQDKTKQEEEDESDSDSDDEDNRRDVMEVHQGIFELQQDYRFLCQITKSSYNCYAVQDKLTSWVIKINRDRAKHKIPREILCLSRCANVPHVMKLHRWHTLSNGYYAMVTPEYVDHELSMIFESHATIQSYMRQLFVALQGCYKCGVVHRDIKPGNVYFDATAKLLTLADFDSATTNPERIRKYNYIGTDGFRSPELSNGLGYTWRTDLYSAGVTFGMLLYHVDSEVDVDNALVNTWRKNARKPCENYTFHGDKHAQELLWKLIEKNPNKRPSYEQCLNHKYFQTVYKK